MIKKDFEHPALHRSHRLCLKIITSGIAFLSMIIMLASPTLVLADGVPGGNIADPVVSAIDVAKPAVVRIYSTIGGSVTVRFTATQSATFPLNGGTYKLKISGSGAFISAHGDILTADHVVNPPHHDLDTGLYEMASQDVANYINQNLNPSLPFSQLDALALMTNGNYRSVTRYGNASSDVYLSTDYTGTLDATNLNALGADVHVPVDKIEQESAVDQHDVAVIHVNMEDTASIQLGESLDVKPLDNLTIIGFPGNADVSDKRDPTQELTSSVNKIYVSALKQTDVGAPVIEVGGNVEHGDSGGPALDSKGNIVGVVSFGLAASDPQGTSFLQASSSAMTLIQELNLDTKPGSFERAWQQAFADYVSTKPGHWHKAQKELQQLSDKYDRFNAVSPYLNYAQGQAKHEQLPLSTPPKQSSNIVAIALGILTAIVLILLAGLLFFMARRKAPAVKSATPYSSSAMQPHTPTYTFSEWASQRSLQGITPPPDALQASIAYKEKNHMWEQQDLGAVAPAQSPYMPFPRQPSTPEFAQDERMASSGPIEPAIEEDRNEGNSSEGDVNSLSTAKMAALQQQTTVSTLQDETHSHE